MARQEAGFYVAAQGLYSLKLKPRRTIRLESAQIRGMVPVIVRQEAGSVAKDAQMRVGKQLQAAKGPNLKQAE